MSMAAVHSAQVKTLQKRLIGKTEEAVEKDLIIQEKIKLHLELQEILAKHTPGAAIVTQVSAYQTYLKDITREMKAIAAELNMHHAQVSEHKDDI